MARSHEVLLARARSTSGECSSAVLNLGSAVAFQAACTARLLDENSFVDPTVLEELSQERRRLVDDLELLEHLDTSSPGCADVRTLATAIVARMQHLLEREQRALYRPILRHASGADAKT